MLAHKSREFRYFFSWWLRSGNQKATGVYELICGEGRLTAYRDLGKTHIPEEVVTCNRKEAYLESLVETSREPLVFYPEKEDHIILDGYQRYRILLEMGVEKVPCLVWREKEAVKPPMVVPVFGSYWHSLMASEILGC